MIFKDKILRVHSLRTCADLGAGHFMLLEDPEDHDTISVYVSTKEFEELKEEVSAGDIITATVTILASSSTVNVTVDSMQLVTRNSNGSKRIINLGGQYDSESSSGNKQDHS